MQIEVNLKVLWSWTFEELLKQQYLIRRLYNVPFSQLPNEVEKAFNLVFRVFSWIKQYRVYF